MRILTSNNEIADTDVITEGSYHYSVLSFRDSKNPDFFMEKLTHVDITESAQIALKIGPYRLVMPMVWSVIVTDYDILECVPLHEVLGKKLNVFCMNPIDGFFTEYYPIETGSIYPVTRWSAPPLTEKDMLVVPLGMATRQKKKENGELVKPSPICAIFSPTKMEINKAISDVWE
jgi:hypothetical protein